MGKLLNGETWEEAKVMRDKEGNVVTDGSGKLTDDYNCEDFDSQNQAQKFFDKVKADTGKDPNRLDGDKDGDACEALPKEEKTDDIIDEIKESLLE